jgi:hypothetical protein
MPRDGALILSDLRRQTLSIVCEPCGRRGTYNVARRAPSAPYAARRRRGAEARREAIEQFNFMDSALAMWVVLSAAIKQVGSGWTAP